MKSVILIFVSIVFLSGCDFGNLGPTGPERSCYEYYKATLTAHYENGKSCTTAYARTTYGNEGYDEFIDSTGTLHITITMTCSEKNTQTRIFPITVYCSRIRVWSGDIQMAKFENWFDDNWPDPSIEIVVPDSLAW